MNQENKINPEDLENQLNAEVSNDEPVQNPEPVQDVNPAENNAQELQLESETPTTEEPKDLEAYFKEHRENGEHYEVRRFGGLIVILALIAIGLGGYILFNKKLKIEEPNTNNKPVEKKEEINVKKDNNFSYDNYEIKLPKVIDSYKDLYYIYSKTEDNINYEIYGRYTNETDVLIANIKCKDKVILDSRVFDVNDGKLYFVTKSKGTGEIFEISYIDFNDLSLGAKPLKEFVEVYKKENLFTGAQDKTYYSSYLYVKDDDIFYTSFVEGSLKKYNLKSKKNETLVKNILWMNFFVDKRNNNIFYFNEAKKFYVTDLNGKNSVRLKNVEVNSSDFWLRAYYNNKPVFGFSDGSEDTMNINAYDFKTKTFIEVQKSANVYNIKYNNIDMDAKNDLKIDGYLYIA